MTITQYIADHQQRLEKILDNALPRYSSELHMAMRYATLGGGKRFRPLLVYSTGETMGADPYTLDRVAAAVELVHTYSLVHDDLPAMDDDALRRGKPSCHKAFNEATAILAGDALLTLAFEVLSTERLHVSADIQLKIINRLAKASGAKGMVLGQSLDLFPDDLSNIESLNNIHLHKTGQLIQASVLMGALAAGCDDEDTLKYLASFGNDLGLAYQIQDDILDLTTSAERIEAAEGVRTSTDNVNYSMLLGTEAAEEEVKRYYQCALEKLAAVKLQESFLAELTAHMLQRDR